MRMQENQVLAPRALSSEDNAHACQLVLASVAKYPQSGESMAILADRLLDEFDSPRALATGIGIREMALLTVESKSTAERINRVHSAFGIEYMVTPEQAAGIVTGVAFGALEYIRIVTMNHRVRSAALHDLFMKNMIIIPGALNDPTSVSRCNVPAAFSLQNRLAQNRLIRMEVTRQVKHRANNLRRQSRSHQEVVRELYAYEHLVKESQP